MISNKFKFWKKISIPDGQKINLTLADRELMDEASSPEEFQKNLVNFISGVIIMEAEIDGFIETNKNNPLFSENEKFKKTIFKSIQILKKYRNDVQTSIDILKKELEIENPTL